MGIVVCTDLSRTFRVRCRVDYLDRPGGLVGVSGHHLETLC